MPLKSTTILGVMANVPSPKSFQQFLGKQINTVRSRLGIRRFKPGGPLLTILEASAQGDAQNSADIFNSLTAKELDNAEDLTLDRIGNDEGLPRRRPRAAVGSVVVSDSSFVKQASTLSHAKAAPIVGSTVVYVTNGLSFDTAGSTGSIYLGRGTSNYEGPLEYSQKQDQGTYWTLSLSTPTTHFHNQGELVVLAQGGNRVIPVGQVITTNQSVTANQQRYTTTEQKSIEDGETESAAITVVCSTDGSVGNQPPGALVGFGGSPPFPGATVTNPTQIRYGRDTETDQEYRDRIRQNRANKKGGTASAIKAALIDLSAPDESSSVLSANVVKRTGRPTIVVIDDGNGYEEKSSGVGFESLIDSAAGGETDFLTTNGPVAQAFVEATNLAPYVVRDGTALTVRVGGVASTHYFDLESFSSATPSAYDIVSSINSNYNLLFQARVTQQGASFCVFATSETNDDLEVVAAEDPELDGAVLFGLSTSPTYTTSVYKNDRLLSKDGALAQLTSNRAASWGALSVSETLIVSVDGTAAATYTINDALFQSLGYPLLSNATVDVWCKVLTATLPGITATKEDDRIVLTSNKGRNSQASVEILGGTLVTKGVFSTGLSQGVSFDYLVDRAVGSIVLQTPLSAGDKLTLGTTWAKAFVETDFGSSEVVLTADSSYDIVLDDDSAELVPTPTFRLGQYKATPYNCYGSSCTQFHILDSSNVPVTVSGLAQGDWVLFNDPAFDATPQWKGMFKSESAETVVVSQSQDVATRIGHTATPTGDGLVFVMGGCTSIQPGIGAPGALKGRNVTGSCLQFDSANGEYTQMPSMLVPRAYHTATYIPGVNPSKGKIFIAGGFDKDGNALSSTEILDLDTMTFTPGPQMLDGVDGNPLARAHHTATLTNNYVWVACGTDGTNVHTLVAAYDYTNNVWSDTKYKDLVTARYGHQAVDLGNGTILFLGGISAIAAEAVPISSAEQLETGIGALVAVPAMTSPRAFFGAAFDGTDKVVVAGCGKRLGTNNNAYLVDSATTSDFYTVGGAWNGDIPLGGEFCQNDLAVTRTAFTIIAVGVSSVGASYKTLAFTGSGWANHSGAPLTALVSTNREGLIAATLIGADAIGETIAWFGGGLRQGPLADILVGVSSIDQQLVTTSTCSRPFGVFTDLALEEGRLLAVRSDNPPVKLIVPFDLGYKYTAPSFAAVLDSPDLTAQDYQTTKVRVATKSSKGSILVVDKDQELPELTSSLPTSQPSQYATVVSNSDIDIPAGFQLFTVGASITEDSLQSLSLPTYIETLAGYTVEETPAVNGNAVGLNRYAQGTNEVTTFPGCKGGRAKNLKAVLGAADVADLGTTVNLRSSLPVFAGEPIYLGSPFKFAVSDTLNVMVDQDSDSKRFVIPMARKMATNGDYQSPLSLKDADNGNATISKGFGVDYDFNDFAIVSRARGMSYVGTDKSVLWRYYRYGEEGNHVGVRYVYPSSATQPVSVSVSPVQEIDSFSYYKGLPQVTVDISIGSGAARQNRNMSVDTRVGTTIGTPSSGVSTCRVVVGYSVTHGQRALNGDTSLTITVPNVAGQFVSPGLSAGDVMYYHSDAPSSGTMMVGQFAIKSISGAGATRTVVVDALKLNDGTAWNADVVATVSTDPNQKASFDAGVLVNDLIVFTGTNGLPATGRITAIDTGRQQVTCIVPVFDASEVRTTPSYQKMGSTSSLLIFAPPSRTVAELVSAVNAIPGTPVTGTVVGTSTDVITLASWDQAQEGDYRVVLSDGINYVANTNKPANDTLQTTFDLKLPLSSELLADSDFPNEVFYLVPQLTKSVVAWLNTPAVTGLWSVADVTSASNGTKVQICTKTPGQAGSVFVEGGFANLQTASIQGTPTETTFADGLDSGMVVTTSIGEASGFCGNSWVELNNTTVTQKVGDDTTTWGANNQVESITTDGLITFSVAPYTKSVVGGYSESTSLVDFEKIGRYGAIIIQKGINRNASMSLAVAGNWLRVVEAGTSTMNTGLFRILRVSQTESAWVYWIDNPNLVERAAVSTILTNISSDSIVPGDSIVVISTGFGGVANKRTWGVINVGNGYTDATVQVSLTDGRPSAWTGNKNTYVRDITVTEGVPAKSIKKLLSISPSSTNTSQVQLLLADSKLLKSWSQASGTVLTAIEKLGFPSAIALGADGYRYNTGLIAEVKRVIYGDSGDSDNYPGIVNEGASVLFQGPTIKRIKLAVQIRLQTNNTTQSVADAVRNAVAGIINASPVGQPIAISDIVAAVKGVLGVSAVSIMTPEYTTVNDRILIRGQEKGSVLDPANDIQVLIAGD